ncbi:hypothetical protein RO787_28550 [Blautia coccoides]|uniref:carbohydrate-binding protein n=1 Tax=Blautia producta TaxID=33035 RepID=UPI0028A33535|nr:carbohydrate-binding protein [Blautia coccoides]MDT4377270.1 hypothetical protein [Blautia coccoides]
MSIIERARELRSQIEDNAGGMSDYMALQHTELFASWTGDGVAYKAGDRVRYNDILYKVLQDHISQGGWRPESTSSLYAKVLIPDPGVVPEWEQPDSTNPYSKGDKVLHNDKTWESLVDGNVWEPGTTGTEGLWKEVTE